MATFNRDIVICAVYFKISYILKKDFMVSFSPWLCRFLYNSKLSSAHSYPPSENITKQLREVTDENKCEVLVHLSTGISATRSIL